MCQTFALMCVICNPREYERRRERRGEDENWRKNVNGRKRRERGAKKKDANAKRQKSRKNCLRKISKLR